MNNNTKITVLILTYNEEVNIPHALKNVMDWAHEVVILDSYSTDKTIEIAKQYGAKVFFKKFEDFSSQRKHAFKELPFEGDWIFVLDADEYLTEELKDEIKNKIKDTKDDAFIINRRFYWKNKWIKRGYYPTKLLRFGRKGKIDCDDRPINEHIICKNEKVGYLKNDFIDHNRKDIYDWIAKHNDYSNREAKQLFDKEYKKYNFFGSQYERKSAIRVYIWNKLPPIIRPFLYFFYRYVFKLGFLDGKEAFQYHFLHAFIFRMIIDFKYLEMKWRKN